MGDLRSVRQMLGARQFQTPSVPETGAFQGVHPLEGELLECRDGT